MLTIAIGFIPYIGFALKQIPKYLAQAEEWRIKRSAAADQNKQQRELDALQKILAEQTDLRLQRIRQARAAGLKPSETINLFGIKIYNPQLLLILKILKIALLALIAAVILGAIVILFF